MYQLKKIKSIIVYGSILGLALIPVDQGLHAGVWEDVKGYFLGSYSEAKPSIDVLIKHDVPSAVVEVQGKYSLLDPHTHSHIATRPNGKKKHFQSLYSGLKWGEEFPGVFQLKVVAERENTPIYVDGVRYNGSLTIYDIGGAISIVNTVPIEDYLQATLPKTVHDPLSNEALSALAIVSRTNAYYYAKNKQNPYWSVDGETVGFKGLSIDTSITSVAAAIEGTKNMVLSRTGAYEGIVTAFPAAWKPESKKVSKSRSLVYSNITLYEAENLGEKGRNAAQILLQAFPNSQINIIQPAG
jgi:stage II sporulation protein D